MYVFYWLVVFYSISNLVCYLMANPVYTYILNIRVGCNFICPVGWGCRIHRLLLCRGVRTPNECPGYDIKQSDGEVPAMLDLWRMRSTPSLPSLPGPLWPGVIAPDKGHIYGLNRTKPSFFHYTDNCVFMLN